MTTSLQIRKMDQIQELIKEIVELLKLQLAEIEKWKNQDEHYHNKTLEKL